MPRGEPGRTFGGGISSVERYYVATAPEGKPLAPKKHPGSRLEEGARR